MNNNSIPEDWKNITDPVLRKKARRKTWEKANKEKLKLQKKIYREANKDKIEKYQKNYRQINKDKLKEFSKNWIQNNKDRYYLVKKTYRQKNADKIKFWQDSHRNYLRIYQNNRYKTNIQYKLSESLRSRLRSALKNNQKIGSAVKDLGCSIDELKVYLESKFLPGMSWNNWTHDGWHIDHIKPLASFDLTDRNQLLQACHYSNLQPLWAKDNICKRDKIL